METVFSCEVLEENALLKAQNKELLNENKRLNFMVENLREALDRNLHTASLLLFPPDKRMMEVHESNRVLKAQNKELLARCDLLEAELCRFQCEIETIVMTLEEI